MNEYVIVKNIDENHLAKKLIFEFATFLSFFAHKSLFLHMTFFRKIMFQDVLYVRETHNLVNGSFEYEIKRILSIKYFNARIPSYVI